MSALEYPFDEFPDKGSTWNAAVKEYLKLQAENQALRNTIESALYESSFPFVKKILRDALEKLNSEES